MCEEMYNENENICSGLVTGTMWDAIMQYIATNKETYEDLKSTSWGNFLNTTLQNIHGRYIAVNSQNGSASGAINAKSINGNKYGILSTAASDDARNHNIYDLAGNLFEWTKEAGWTGEAYITRGGCFKYAPSTSVYYRGCAGFANIGTDFGFRPALFIS